MLPLSICNHVNCSAEATTIEEAAQYIEAVCAFIELPVYLNNPEEIQAGIGLSAHFMQGTSARLPGTASSANA